MKIPRIANEFEYWDLLIKRGDREALVVEDDSVKSLSSSTAEGVIVRGLFKGSWAVASSDRVDDLDSVFSTALKLAKVRGLKIKIDKTIFKDSVDVRVKKNPFNEDLERKLDRLFLISKTIKELNPHITSSFANLAYARRKNEFYDSQGSMIFQKDFKTSYSVGAVARSGDNIQQYFVRDAKTRGLELFYEQDPAVLSQTVAEKVVQLLKAKHAPPKALPVVCDNDLTGVFFHEAVGHACEADIVLSDGSVFKNKLGETIASENVNFVDGIVKNSFGYYRYDDEGVKKRDTPLIVNGVLKNYMHSLDTASKMKMEPTGNGRSDGLSFPIPRMTTSILKPGDCSHEELFEGIKEGIYAVGSTGGQVSTTEGRFTFGAREAFMIRDGQIAEPLRDVNLVGNILNTLKLVEKVGKDVKLSRGGMCGKAGQNVPVDEYCPHIKIGKVIIGGRT